MERWLLLWDEIDDLAGALRHVAMVTAAQVADLAGPAAAVASALGAGLLGLAVHLEPAFASGLVHPGVC